MRVAEILNRKGSDVATVTPEATIGAAVETLRHHGIGAVVVSVDGSSVDGILSERDVVRALDTSTVDLLERPVSEVMTGGVVTCSPGDTIESLMSLMTEKRIRHLPVVRDGGLVGIVSIGDVVKHRVSQLEDETRLMEEYIHHGR